MTKIRRTLARWVVGLLFALLIASFALWGIGDIFRGGRQATTVIEVGDREIDQAEFSRLFRREMRRLREAFGGDLTLEQARRLGLVDQVVQQTITRALFDQQAKTMGLVVADSQVAAYIRSQEAFQNAAGQFDRALFERVMRSAGLSESRFVELVRNDIDRQRLARAATSGIAVPDAMAEAAYRYREERRAAETVRIAYSEVGGVPEPTEANLRTYYEEHAEAFMAPEYRAITLAQLRPEDLAAEIRVSEEELRQAYEERRGELGSKERRHLRQVLVDDRETAQRILDRMRQGRSLAAAAEAVTGGAPIDLGTMTREEMLPELAEPAFALAEGETGGPLQSSLGWHLIQVVDVQAGSTPSFEEARDELRSDIAMRRAVDRLISMANRLDDTLAGGASIEDAAAELGLKVREIPAIDRDGRNRDGEPVAGVPPNEEFLPVVFRTASGEQSLVEETSAGGYYVLRVDGVTPPQRRPFEKVRREVRERWLADQRRQRARELGERIVRGVNEAGRDFGELAREQGLEVTASEAVTRTGRDSPMPPQLAGRLFDIDKGEAVSVALQDGVAVARLSEIRKAEPRADPDGLARVRESLRRSLESDMLAAFADALRETYGVRVNRRQLDSILTQF